MLKERRQAADQVASSLFAAEGAISNAVEKVADLVKIMQTARTSANLSPVIGSDAAFRAISCLKALGEANQELILAHHDLSATQKRVGLGTVAFGVGGTDKPDSDISSTEGRLAIVA
jgi:hypothetical protein